jgi:hypothetical protein
MKRLAVMLVAGVLTFAALPGCGDSGTTKNVGEGADQSAIEAYEAAVAKEGQDMSEGDAEGGGEAGE